MLDNKQRTVRFFRAMRCFGLGLVLVYDDSDGLLQPYLEDRVSGTPVRKLGWDGATKPFYP